MHKSSPVAWSIRLDRIGISASFLCALHCLAMPLLLPLLAVTGLHFLAAPAFEIAMILLAMGIGALSIGRGYVCAHRKLQPVLLLSGGAVLLLASKIPGLVEIELWLIAPGAVCIMVAHLLNLRFCRACPVCHDKHLEHSDHSHDHC